MCRTAGFARVELRNVAEYGVSVACHRRWEAPAESSLRFGAPRLTRVEHNTKGGTRFHSGYDEYVSIWFTCHEEDLALDNVKPQVGSYGVRPIFVAQVKDGSWQANFKLPPGLPDGFHDVAVRLDNGAAFKRQTHRSLFEPGSGQCPRARAGHSGARRFGLEIHERPASRFGDSRPGSTGRQSSSLLTARAVSAALSAQGRRCSKFAGLLRTYRVARRLSALI